VFQEVSGILEIEREREREREREATKKNPLTIVLGVRVI